MRLAFSGMPKVVMAAKRRKKHKNKILNLIISTAIDI